MLQSITTIIIIAYFTVQFIKCLWRLYIHLLNSEDNNMELTRYTFDIKRTDGGFREVTIRKANDSDDFFDTFKTVKNIETLLFKKGVMSHEIKKEL